MPNALVEPRMSTKSGCTALCNTTERKTAASGETKSMASKTRQSNLKFEVTFSSKRPSQGAMKNHPIKSGKNEAAMRGIKETSASP